ncbi:Neuraminidase [Penicillium longicatenatum]|uniref:Neuraminidase n=1 Tax=Penicillium longicatenatum TaxID=1561947 RepID=UPI0025488B75|nr:Neuraminidase [Penicillium longicatenatum]KAJ5630374.1 Neuraminidase [Penicillium longicatenatum]
MKLSHIFTFVATAAAASLKPHTPSPSALSDVTIFDPPTDYNLPRTLYARTIELPNGDLLSTWENYSPEPPLVYFPIYRSKDYGKTWSAYSNVTDKVNGYGLRYQPFLYYLTESIGSFKAGTILLAGNSIPEDLSTTHIDLYASHDQGLTWEFVSHIASGGEALPNNGLTPVWEPFLMTYKGKMICYYSDQRDNATYGQKLVHQVSSDLKKWGPVVDDVAYPTYTDRPGMPTVTKLPNGQYIYMYEYGSFFGTSSYSFPVYYRLSSNPLDFNSAEGIQLIATDGTKPTSAPYVVWTPYGGKHGTIIANGQSSSSIFVNKALGKGEWTKVSSPEVAAYSRSLRVLEGDGNWLVLTGGGDSASTTDNLVSVSVMDLKGLV